jgi:hypothetical protein
VVAKVRERLAVNKQRSQRFNMERFNLKKLHDVEGIEQFRVEDSNRFASLEDLDSEVEINSVWETIRENIKISAKGSLGYFEFKKHMKCFDEGCSELLDQRKQAKLQWLQDPSEINGDNLNNVRREASRYFRNKKREHLKDKINEGGELGIKVISKFLFFPPKTSKIKPNEALPGEYIEAPAVCRFEHDQ